MLSNNFTQAILAILAISQLAGCAQPLPVQMIPVAPMKQTASTSAQPKPVSSQNLLKQIKKAIKGLDFGYRGNEGEGPYEAKLLPGEAKLPLNKGQIRRLTKHTPNIPVELETLEELLDSAINPEPGQELDENDLGHVALYKLLKANLNDIQVFVVGEPDHGQMDIYITGQVKGTKDLIIVTTMSIET